MPTQNTRPLLNRALLTLALALAALRPAPADAEMESALLHHLANANLRGTQVSVCVMDIGASDLLAEIHAQREMIPASNMKLVTSAAALDTLGQDFTFSTKLRLLNTQQAPAGDGLPALVVQGDGDPAFGAPKVLEQAGYNVEQMIGWWLDAVEDTGLDTFGQLIIDDRVFEHGPDQRIHPTWPDNQLHKWYCAQVMGINFYDNCFSIKVSPTRRHQPARVAVYPFGPFVQTELRLTTGRANQWGIITPADANRIQLRGTLSNKQQAFVAMHDPAMVFGEMLKHQLAKRGVSVGQVVRPAADQRLEDGQTLHQVNTTLQAVLNRTNQDSMNLYAEALLKRTGHAVTGRPGTFENGAAAVRAYLAKHLDDPTLAASIQLADGSGLSRDNRLSARALVEVLRVQATGDNFKPYLASLARPETTASLEKRFDQGQDLQAQLFAKTGTINHVSALAGYLVYPDAGPGQSARILAFSILCNGHGLGPARNISAHRVRQVQNELVKLMDEEATSAVALP